MLKEIRVNLGLGYRQYWKKLMYGVNTFYDYDITGGNARLGIGGETWTDYFKLAVNGYFGLTQSHQSKLSRMDDYDERPATGFDVSAEAYLPKYLNLAVVLNMKNILVKASIVTLTLIQPN
nr:inverse autotransporter beta domain-containing protein [Candidatus Arsenophonus triatominarum]